METTAVNKSYVPSLKKNFIYRTLYQVLSVIVPFVTAPYLSRVLGAEGIGIQSYTASVAAYFSLFAVLGTSTYGMREVSIYREDTVKCTRLFFEIAALKLIAGAIVFAAWITFILCSVKYRVFYAALSIELAAVIFDITWFFSAFERFRFVVVRDTIFKLLSVAGIFIFVHGREDLLVYVLLNVCLKLASVVSTYFSLPKFLVRTDFPDFWKHVVVHLKESFVYFIPAVSTSIYTVLDKVLIGVITSAPAENGFYEQTERIIGIIKSLVFVSINAVVGVRISFLYAQERTKEVKGKIDYSMNYILFMGLACCFGLDAIAANFIPMFLGSGYEKVVPLIYIFSPVVIVIGISNCLGSQYYTPAGKRRQSAGYIIVGAIVNLILNCMLIPKYASFGAAAATLVAESVIAALYVLNADGYMSFGKIIRLGWRKAASALLMFAAVRGLLVAINMNQIALCVIQVCSGALIYCVLLLVFKDSWFLMLTRNSFSRLRRSRHNG